MKYGGKSRAIVLYKSFFSAFFNLQTQKVKDKIIWVLKLVELMDVVPEEYLKHITGTIGLYEIRIQQGRNQYRIFCFFETDSQIILLNGFQKKSQKTPVLEMKKAIKIIKAYEEEQKLKNPRSIY
jgi:phage-related protein